MKLWITALSLMLVLGFTTFAQAKEKKSGHGTHGTIASVTGNTFTMTITGKKNADAGKTVTVDASTATITGTLAVGAKVSVEGTLNGDKLTAISVTVSKGHKKKNST